MGAFKYVLGTNTLWKAKMSFKPVMSRKLRNLDYLKNKPKTIWWDIVAGPPGYELSILQDHDLVFDSYDYKIRQLVE